MKESKTKYKVNAAFEFEVKNGENLASILKAFPEAEVKSLIGRGDCWRVCIPTPDSMMQGPCRVAVVESDGAVIGVRPSKAPQLPEVILVRKDGWTLGSSFEVRDEAFKTWEGDWIAEINLVTGKVSAILDVEALDDYGPAGEAKTPYPDPPSSEPDDTRVEAEAVGMTLHDPVEFRTVLSSSPSKEELEEAVDQGKKGYGDSIAAPPTINIEGTQSGRLTGPFGSNPIKEKKKKEPVKAEKVPVKRPTPPPFEGGKSGKRAKGAQKKVKVVKASKKKRKK